MGVTVSVFSGTRGRSGFSYSGYDGMYYLYGIPPGPYTLELWLHPNARPRTYPIQVFPSPWPDIPQIHLPPWPDPRGPIAPTYAAADWGDECTLPRAVRPA